MKGLKFMMDGLDQKCPNCGRYTKDCSAFIQELLKWMREGYKFRDAYTKAQEEVIACNPGGEEFVDAS